MHSNFNFFHCHLIHGVSVTYQKGLHGEQWVPRLIQWFLDDDESKTQKLIEKKIYMNGKPSKLGTHKIKANVNQNVDGLGS